MDTEESESEEDGDEQVENHERKDGEGKMMGGEDITGSGDEEETREDVGGYEGSQVGEDKEVESEGERVEEQDVEGNVGSKEGVEGRIGEVDDEIVEEEEEIGEKEEERDDGENEQAQVVEEEIETEIVLVDDITTDDQGTPTDDRSTRRHSRRNRKLDEEALASRAKELRLSDTEETGDDILQAQETLAAEKDISPEALETRYEAERKRKGKHAAKPQKKKPRQASTTVVIREATPETVRVPFAHPTEEEEEQEEVDEETENPQTEEGVFEKIEVLVTKRLLEAMVQFEDPKLQQACDGRAANGKLAKSGKSLCLSDLRKLGVEKKFISYFKSIGFEWLLDHCEKEVSVALAKEFFTSFKFKSTTDLDADSITFRLFNEEMVMSIREWSLRMGYLRLRKMKREPGMKGRSAHPRIQRASMLRRPGE